MDLPKITPEQMVPVVAELVIMAPPLEQLVPQVRLLVNLAIMAVPA